MKLTSFIFHSIQKNQIFENFGADRILSFILLLVFLFFFLFVLFVIKINMENLFEGIDEPPIKKEVDTYDDTVTENNTNIGCDDFCKRLSSIKNNCEIYNDDKIQKCLNKNKAPIQPKCRYKEDIHSCINIA